MALYLLDTHIISFLVRRTHPALDHRFSITPKSKMFTSAICEAELRFGVALLPDVARVRETTLAFLEDIEVRPWNSQCAESFAFMSAKQQRLGKPLARMDALIAAHALADDFILVTNDAVFRQVEGLRVEDWTKGPQSA